LFEHYKLKIDPGMAARKREVIKALTSDPSAGSEIVLKSMFTDLAPG
jgi:hypothetical protein